MAPALSGVASRPFWTQRWWALSGRAMVASGLSPRFSWGAGGSLDLGASHGALASSLTVGAEGSTSAPVSADGATVTFASALASVEACPASWRWGRLSVRPCLRVDAGARFLRGEDIPHGRGVTVPWVDVGPGP